MPRKKFCLLLVLVMVTVTALPASVVEAGTGTWEPVGLPGFSTNSVVADIYNPQLTSLSLFVDQGTPYAAYQETDGDIVVSGYKNGSWRQVGGNVDSLKNNSSVSLFVYEGIL